MMEAKEKIRRARKSVMRDHVFLRFLSMKMQLKEDDTCQTAYTNGKVIGFNPKFIDSLSLDQCKGVFAHELLHVCTNHHTRMKYRENRKWNIAADYAINPFVLERYSLPQGALSDTQFDNMSAEQIYDRLPNQPDDGNSDPGGTGEVREPTNKDGSPMSDAEITKEENEWKVLTAQAAQFARAAGQISGNLGRLINDLVSPQLPWQTILRRFISQAAKNDYTWQRPSRRFISQGLYLPSCHSEELGEIVMVLDTSGSISEEVLSQFAVEMSAILEEFPGCTVHEIDCDYEIQHYQEHTYYDLPLKLELHGGGGTSFIPPFEEVERREIDPVCLVYLTDGECSDFPPEPDYPVIWIHIGEYAESPPFGEIVKI